MTEENKEHKHSAKEEKVVGTVEKKEEKKKIEIKKRYNAITRGNNVGISTKQSMAICKFIKNKDINTAIAGLEQVIAMKKALPMKGELPHRKGGVIGRYPITACKAFVQLLKNLNANASVNNINEPYIYFAKADKASSPFRRFGSRRFKRSNILLMVREIKHKKGNKK
jgi:Ribosomal protein L22p/L17e.